tara:strand:- start:2836 stop:3468 length:633 start_codon:yes stop_codon:yes gene_type:complete
MIKYFYILVFLSITIPGSFSRIITTVDPPSSYIVEGISKETGITLFSQDYDNKIGINVGYQQIIFYREKFNLYAGAEFMLGKKAESKIAFHSVYIMPSFLLKDNLALSVRFGMTQINTDQSNFNLDMGLLGSLGLEYKISDNITLGFDYCLYDIKNKTVDDISGFNPPLISNISEDDIEIEPIDMDLSYSKFGFSIIYGLEINNKKEKRL